MKYTWIPEGVGVDRVLDEWAVGLADPKCVQLCGELKAVDLRVAPGATVISLKGRIYLSHGSYIRNGQTKTIMGVVSCVDKGQPRVFAGSLNRLISGGIHAYLVPFAQSDGASTPSNRETLPTGLPVLEEDDISPDEDDIPTLAPDDSMSDREFVHSTTEMPKLTALQGLSSGSGWGAAVAASDAVDSTDGGSIPEEAPPTEELVLKLGDILLHPRFGRCRVARGPMFGKVKVRRPTGALIDLHLKVLSFTRNPDEDGARVYALRIGRK